MKKLYRFVPLIMVVAVVLLEACSARKNTAGSRFWQALNTRYNVYYHGKTNYDEQIKILEDEYQDDYSQRVFVHPAEAKANPKAPQPSGSFDRTIEKMQKAIALHSIKKKPNRKAGKGSDPKYKEWMKRDEYNPFLHNAWYLLAKSEYMKGDFLNAAATFRYIYKHFTWKEDLAMECQVWEALSYCAMGWTNEADNVLAHIHIDKIENNRIRSLANLAFADYNIKEKRNEQAIPYLAEALKGAKGSQKVRLNFLLGQLYEDAGQKDLAYQAFKKAGSSNSSTYRTKFNARIKQSAVFSGTNVSSEVKALRNMTRYDRNKEYLDQIYYAIGNLYLSRQDTVNAIENYKKAAEKSTRNGVDKAISQITLGGLYFAQHKYDLAQPCYAEAIPQINEDYPNYKMLKHRSDVLDELSVYSQNVTLQDSLLTLSKMPLEEQKKVIKKIIDELKKKEKEEEENAKREEYMAQQQGQNNLPNKGNQPTQYQINNDNSWYFYNTATKAAGKTQFQQTWGNRKLEDNWRRRNKNTFSLGDESSSNDDSATSSDSTAVGNDSTKVDKEALKRAEDPHFEEYYLKQIPKTEEQIQAAHDIIMEGLYNMGVILKDKLEDMEAAEYQFKELQRRYPDNSYRLDSYYNMYLMYMRYGYTARAEECRDTILTNFADSKYGQAMQDPYYLDNLKNMETDQEEMYAQAYSNYLDNNNDAVHEAYDDMMRKYPLSKIMPKFMFIDALSYVTQKNYDKFKETLKDMLQRYPETDITPVASSMVKQLNSGRKLTGGSTNTRGMVWSTRLSNDTTPQDLERKFTPFKEDFDKPHVFILLYPTDSVNSNLLLYEVARHNFNAFVVKDYDIEQMTFSRLGLLCVKGFENYDEVVHYRTVFDEDKDMVIPEGLHRVLISESNFQLLLNEGRSFEDYFNYLENRNDSVVEAKVPELKEIQKEQEAQEAAITDTNGNIKHVVKAGDKLSKLAQKYGVSVNDIKAANNLTDDKIKLGDTLVIPTNASDSDTRKQAEEARKAEEAKKKEEARKQAEVKKAEEAKKKEESRKQAEAKKAEEAKKKEEEARKAQERAELKSKEEIIRQKAEADGNRTHRVRQGDKLSKIALKYGVSVDDIKAANNLADDKIKVGDILVIPNSAPANNPIHSVPGAAKNSTDEAGGIVSDPGEGNASEKETEGKTTDEVTADGNRGDEKSITENKVDEKRPPRTQSREELMRKAREGREKARAKEREEAEKAREQAANNAASDDDPAGNNNDNQDKKRSVRDTKNAEKDQKQIEKERKQEQERLKKEQEAKRKKEQEERKKEQEERNKKQQQAKKEEQAKFDAQIKQEKQDTKAREKDEQKRLKEQEKAEKKRMKELAKIEKQRQDSIKRAEKEADKLLAKRQKALADSIALADKAREDSLDALDQARLDARKQLQKDRATIEREKIQAKEDAKKQAEKERKERMKAKEQERKEKEKARKEKQKEREKAQKEREKQRKEEAKQREKEQKEKQKQREAERKQKEKDREQARKQREQERKDKASSKK